MTSYAEPQKRHSLAQQTWLVWKVYQRPPGRDAGMFVAAPLEATMQAANSQHVRLAVR